MSAAVALDTPLMLCKAELVLTARERGGDRDGTAYAFNSADAAQRFRQAASLIGGAYGFDVETDVWQRGLDFPFKVTVRLSRLADVMRDVLLSGLATVSKMDAYRKAVGLPPAAVRATTYGECPVCRAEIQDSCEGCNRVAHTRQVAGVELCVECTGMVGVTGCEVAS